MASTGEPFGLFWNSDNGDRTYDASSFEYWLKKFFTSGVFNGDLQVQATSGMTIKVGAGYANVDGKVKFWNAEFNLTLNPANSTYPRIDTIVITRDNVNREIRCEVVTGGYSGDTPQPTAPVRNAEIYQLVLAQIYVANGATGITQAEITDIRPNTDLCGWITGTVTELDFEQFTVQFESYFAQFKRQHETEWSLWETTQKAAYAAWLSEVKAQQVQDKANWDAWYAALQEELHELPADTAEYLQIEIDEIKQSGTTGSILHITTTNSELEGKTVTVSCGSETKIGTFDSNLECTIIGFKSVGTLTITSTDGVQTAAKTVDIDYYSKYEIAIAFWSATVNIQGDDNLKGTGVVVKDSNNTTITTITLNAVTGQGVFEAQKADTYTFNYTVNGTAYSVPLAVTEETTYELSLTAGFNYKQWVTLGGLDPTDYTDLEDVFADEVAVRRLMTIHTSSDYLIEKVTDDVDTIDAFCANDTAMKWIGLRDYVCDGLTAITGVEAKFLASQYWERYLKDHVPVMTSNTAPYGTANANSAVSGFEAYKMFDNSISTYWGVNNASAGNYAGYTFTNPICVKAIEIFTGPPSGNNYLNTFKVQASNDGFINDVHDLTGTLTVIPQDGLKKFSISNDAYYLSYRIYALSSVTACYVNTLQFYGRSLDVSVPVMTSDTAPYGEVSVSSTFTGYSSYAPFKGNPTRASDNQWTSAQGENNSWLEYKFISDVVIKKIELYIKGLIATQRSVKFQAKNSNNEWVDISNNVNIPTQSTPSTITKYVIDVTNEIKSKEFRFICNGVFLINGNSDYCIVNGLQFYGVDYSEKEFETGSTKKWLYDHGVELETLATKDNSVIGDDYIQIRASSSTYYGMVITDSTLDLTDYSLVRVKLGDIMSAGIQVQSSTGNTTSTDGRISYVKYTSSSNASYLPNNLYLDVSSINQSAYLNMVAESPSVNIDVEEWWLE